SEKHSTAFDDFSAVSSSQPAQVNYGARLLVAMRQASSLALLGLAAGVAAQTVTAPYTDPLTGIDFQAYTDPETGYIFGIALPETVGTDFIGQVVAPLTDGAGWAGVSLGGAMVGPLLVVTWPNEGEVQHSFRQATDYATPPVFDGSVSLSTIPTGTSVNETHIALTFLCAGCVDADLSFAPDAESSVMGFAVSDSPPEDPADEGTELVYHSFGFGEFGVLTSDAKSAEYDEWAALATGGAASSSAAQPSASA
ncbi:hypothetical protein GGG16DRAFT_54323, partial [Schizophyllum commune]